MTQVPDGALEWLAYVLHKHCKEVCEGRNNGMLIHRIVGSALEVKALYQPQESSFLHSSSLKFLYKNECCLTK